MSNNMGLGIRLWYPIIQPALFLSVEEGREGPLAAFAPRAPGLASVSGKGTSLCVLNQAFLSLSLKF